MKASISFCIVTLVALCAADFGNLPDCAKDCASNIPAECNLDIGCICKSNNWLENISCCISSNCPAKDQADTIDQAQKICKMYVSLNRDLDPSHFPGWIYTSALTDWFHSGGVSLASTLPPCATSTGAVAASSTGSSDSSDTTTTDTTATTAASEAVVTTTASQSTATATASEAVVTTTASESTATATASSSNEEENDTTTSASSTRATAAIGGNPGAAANSPSAAASTGAANHLMVPGVGAAGLVFAAFALL